MRKDIINFKTVTITNLKYINSDTWRQIINVEFPVDEIILKTACIADGTLLANRPNITIIRSNLIDNNVLFCYPLSDTVNDFPEISFKMHHETINGEYTFTFSDFDDTRIVGFSVSMAIVLMFIQDKPYLF